MRANDTGRRRESDATSTAAAAFAVHALRAWMAACRTHFDVTATKVTVPRAHVTAAGAMAIIAAGRGGRVALREQAVAAAAAAAVACL